MQTFVGIFKTALTGFYKNCFQAVLKLGGKCRRIPDAHNPRLTVLSVCSIVRRLCDQPWQLTPQLLFPILTIY